MTAGAQRRQAEREQSAALRELRASRLQKLEDLRREAEAKKAETAEQSAAVRLEYLMKQALTYTTFVPSGGGAANGKDDAAGGAAGGKRGKHAMSAKDEAEELKDEEAELAARPSTRLLRQPALITGGTLREYQVRS